MDLIETAIIGRFQRKARHQMTDVLVEPGPDENSAKVLYRALVTDWREGAGRVSMCVNYTAACVRTDNGWKFAIVSTRVLPERRRRRSTFLRRRASAQLLKQCRELRLLN
jgi:hypothetical protein